MRSFKQFAAALVMILSGALWAAPASAVVRKFAAIEIGGSNVKYVRLNVDVRSQRFLTPEDQDEDNKVENPGLAAELEDDGSGRLDPDKITETAGIVNRFVRTLTHTKDVPKEHIAVIGSSGLVHAKNRDELVAAVREQTGIEMDFVTAENEVRFTLFGVVPDDELFTAELVDVGSSNTKWGHLQPAANEAGYTMISAHIPAGSKTLHKTIETQVGEFAEPEKYQNAARAARQRIKAELQQQATASGSKPLDKVYLSGGAVWAMVTLVKPETAREEYPRLTAEDFETYSDRLTTDKTRLFGVEYSDDLSTEVRQRAEDDLQTVSKIFSPEQIVAGGQILLAFVEQFDWNAPDKEIYFARQGYKAWITGYLKEFARRRLRMPPDRTKLAAANPLLAAQRENDLLKQLLLKRTWTLVSGREATATLVGFEQVAVMLEGEGGRVNRISLENLSLRDRRFLLRLSRHAAGILGIPLPELRTWTAAGGGKTVEAALISRNADQIRFLRSDGHIFTVPAKLLSPADQEFLTAAAD